MVKFDYTNNMLIIQQSKPLADDMLALQVHMPLDWSQNAFIPQSKRLAHVLLIRIAPGTKQNKKETQSIWSQYHHIVTIKLIYMLTTQIIVHVITSHASAHSICAAFHQRQTAVGVSCARQGASWRCQVCVD